MRFATLLLLLGLAACSQNVAAPSTLETQATGPFKLTERTPPNCDVTIGLEQTYVKAENIDYDPGDTICLEAGKRLFQQFIGFKGTAEKPLTFINVGGQVQIGKIGSRDHYYGFVFNDSKHFKLSGAGSPGHIYGIKVDGTRKGAVGLGFGSRSDNFEVEYVEVANTGFAGLMAKSDDTNKGVPKAERWTMHNISIHDTYIHDTGGEGVYIGQTKTYSGSHDIHGVRVFDNVITRTGWDGFQIANANRDVKIYNNVIYQAGLAGEEPQNKGFQLGSNTIAKVFDNVISEADSQCAIIINAGKQEVWNNYLGDCGAEGVYITNNAPQLIPPGASATYRYNFLRQVGAGKAFFFVNNPIYPLTASKNKLGGSNPELSRSNGDPSTISVTNNRRRDLPKVQFTVLPGGALCVKPGSFYDGKSLGPAVCTQ